MTINETMLKSLPFIIFIVLVLVVVVLIQLNKGVKCLPSKTSENFSNSFKGAVAQTTTKAPTTTKVSTTLNTVTTPSPLLNFSKQTQYDFPTSGTLQTFSSVTPSQCAQTCLNNSSCSAFVYNNKTNYCYIKKPTLIKDGLSNGNTDVYFKNTDALTSNYTQSPGIDYSNIIQNYNTANPNQCAQYCSSNPNCNYFVTENDKNPNCWLKNKNLVSNPNPNINTYFMKTIRTVTTPNPNATLPPNSSLLIGNPQYSYLNVNGTLWIFDASTFTFNPTDISLIPTGDGVPNINRYFTPDCFMGIFNSTAYYYDYNLSLQYTDITTGNNIGTVYPFNGGQLTAGTDVIFPANFTVPPTGINSLFIGVIKGKSYFVSSNIYNSSSPPVVYSFNGSSFTQINVGLLNSDGTITPGVPRNLYTFTGTSSVSQPPTTGGISFMGTINNVSYFIDCNYYNSNTLLGTLINSWGHSTPYNTYNSPRIITFDGVNFNIKYYSNGSTTMKTDTPSSTIKDVIDPTLLNIRNQIGLQLQTPPSQDYLKLWYLANPRDQTTIPYTSYFCPSYPVTKLNDPGTMTDYSNSSTNYGGNIGLGTKLSDNVKNTYNYINNSAINFSNINLGTIYTPSKSSYCSFIIESTNLHPQSVNMFSTGVGKNTGLVVQYCPEMTTIPTSSIPELGSFYVIGQSNYINF